MRRLGWCETREISSDLSLLLHFSVLFIFPFSSYIFFEFWAFIVDLSPPWLLLCCRERAQWKCVFQDWKILRLKTCETYNGWDLLIRHYSTFISLVSRSTGTYPIRHNVMLAAFCLKIAVNDSGELSVRFDSSILRLFVAVDESNAENDDAWLNCSTLSSTWFVCDRSQQPVVG